MHRLMLLRSTNYISGKIPIKSYSSKVKFVKLPSALYIPQKIETNHVFSIIKPYYEFDDLIYNKDKVMKMLQRRKITFDLDNLITEIEKYNEFVNHQKSIIKDIKSVKCQIRRLINKFNIQAESSISNLKAELESLKKENENIDSFLYTYLKLPAPLHSFVEDEDKDIFNKLNCPIFKFKAKSHIEIGLKQGELEFKEEASSAAFLKGVPSIIEYACTNFVCGYMLKQEFNFVSLQDFDRAPLVEGCGIDVNDLLEVLQLNDRFCLISNKHTYLMGSASISSLVSIMSKRNIRNYDTDSVNIFTCGHIYKPIKNKNLSLFNTSQSTCVSGLCIYRSDIKESIKNMVLNLINETYSEFNIHFKIVNVGAPNLELFEEMAYSILMFNTFNNDYIEVGRVSFCGNFISKRLEILFNQEKHIEFAEMIYIKLIDVTKWLGCLIENTQNADGNYSYPKCLEDYMLTNCNSFDKTL